MDKLMSGSHLLENIDKACFKCSPPFRVKDIWNNYKNLNRLLETSNMFYFQDTKILAQTRENKRKKEKLKEEK